MRHQARTEKEQIHAFSTGHPQIAKAAFVYGFPSPVSAAGRAVTRVEGFAYLLFRTQLFNSEDFENVEEIEDSYRAEPAKLGPLR